MYLIVGLHLQFFRIARHKEAVIADHMYLLNGQLQWDINFMRTMQDWELEAESSFLSLLYSTKVGRDGEDKSCLSERVPMGVLGFGDVRMSSL
jgi:hypothetical protein